MCHTLSVHNVHILGEHFTTSLFDCKRDAIAVLLFDFSLESRDKFYHFVFGSLVFHFHITCHLRLYSLHHMHCDSSCLTFTKTRSIRSSYIFEHFMDQKTERQIS